LIVRPRLALSLDGFSLFRGGTYDDFPIAGPCFHVRFDFHVFPFYEIGVNYQAIARHHPGRRADQLSRSF
jgi:hypothetical protein